MQLYVNGRRKSLTLGVLSITVRKTPANEYDEDVVPHLNIFKPHLFGSDHY